MADRPLRRLFWWVLSGTRGGPTRLLILMKLRDGPANANRIAASLRLNYKTIQHHLEILLENRFVEADEGKYDVKYRLAPIVLENMDILDSIIEEAFKARARVKWAHSG
ncbi:MAG: winged helix-turn-helix domain-containing protein [Candidatus Caldarchaeum sp.]|nr:winged helix-turn-helix domain-containing protein [Candidatus Caldarchaeum sp.]